MLAYINLDDAIQKMDDLYKADCDTYGVSIPECFDNDRAINALKELPTVFMPSTNSFSWCVGCKEYDQENHCCHLWSNVISNTVEENMEYLEQVKWERDLAVKQLEDLGYGLGEKPRVGKWIKDIERFGDNAYHCSKCGAVLEKDDLEWRNNYYCYRCGVDMRGGQDDSISN